jgi:NAD(P)-dependent dehydrogenase (short-subunit alcohol dehydrogenase family)
MATSQPRVWLITGASSGFGRAIADAALAAGDIVVAAARRTDALADLVASSPEHVTALALDVTDTDRIRAAVAEVLDRHGRRCAGEQRRPRRDRRRRRNQRQ